jgi:hypothetical protein
MRLIIGIFVAFVAAVVAHDLGLRLPGDVGLQFAIVGALSLVSWALVARLSDDGEASHRR